MKSLRKPWVIVKDVKGAAATDKIGVCTIEEFLRGRAIDEVPDCKFIRTEP